MDISWIDAFKALAEPIATISGAVYALYKVSAKLKKDREHESAKIIQEAKEEASRVKSEIDNDLNALKTELATLKTSVEKDFQHAKETHDNEIKNLGEKIEALREELRTQHGQLVGLLSKLIDKT